MVSQTMSHEPANGKVDSAQAAQRTATRARAALRSKRAAARTAVPACTLPVRRGTHGPRQADGSLEGSYEQCGTPTVQNAIERTRGTWWCPRCQRYPWGIGGGRAGGGADSVPPEARR